MGGGRCGTGDIATSTDLLHPTSPHCTAVCYQTYSFCSAACTFPSLSSPAHTVQGVIAEGRFGTLISHTPLTSNAPHALASHADPSPSEISASEVETHAPIMRKEPPQAEEAVRSSGAGSVTQPSTPVQTSRWAQLCVIGKYVGITQTYTFVFSMFRHLAWAGLAGTVLGGKTAQCWAVSPYGRPLLTAAHQGGLLPLGGASWLSQAWQAMPDSGHDNRLLSPHGLNNILKNANNTATASGLIKRLLPIVTCGKAEQLLQCRLGCAAGLRRTTTRRGPTWTSPLSSRWRRSCPQVGVPFIWVPSCCRQCPSYSLGLLSGRACRANHPRLPLLVCRLRCIIRQHCALVIVICV